MANFIQYGSRAIGKVLMIGTAATMLAPTFTYTVPPGHRAIIFDRINGVQPETYVFFILFFLNYLVE